MATPLNSPFFIFHAAADFFERGTLAAADNFKSEESGIKQFDSMIHPKLCMPIVNITFALELTFKGLLKQSNSKPIRTHDLEKLFKELNSEIKEKIVEHYKSHDTYKKLIGIRLIHDNEAEHSKPNYLPAPSKDENGISEILKMHRRYFEDFRYLFDVDEQKEYVFLFREFSNLSFSALVILGETLNLQVVSISKIGVTTK